MARHEQLPPTKLLDAARCGLSPKYLVAGGVGMDALQIEDISGLGHG
jgi:hypothetical protein